MARVIGSLFFHSIEGREVLSPQQQIQQQQQQQPSLSYVHAYNTTTDEIGEHQHPDDVIDDQSVEVVAVFGAIFFAAFVIFAVTLYISKFRKRHNSNSTTCDVELPDAHDATITKEMQAMDEAEFDEYKPSVWRKTLRSVLLRLRGQEQHKDVYVIPSHLREQLKQTYVY